MTPSACTRSPIDAPRSVRTFAACVVVLGLSSCGESIPAVEGIEVALDDENFDEHVQSSSVPVLVDFGASWCGPCRKMEPAVAYLSVQYADRLTVAKVDTDESSGLSMLYAIETLPSFVLFQDGAEVDRIEGAMSYKRLSTWVDKHMEE